MITFQNAQVWFEGKLQAVNVIIDNNLIIQVSPTVVKGRVINLSSDHLILPGFIDVHTHLRTPAPRDYPTSMKSETRAALYGGYQMVCAMPNTVPPIDDNQKLWRQQKAARAQAYLPVYEYAAATVKQAGQQLVNFTGLKPYVFGFSDDGKGFDNHKLFSEFANQLNGTKLVFSVHLQNMAKTQGKTVVDHEKAQVFNQSGFVNADESDQLQWHLATLADQYPNVYYHVAHVSTRQSLALIRQYKSKLFNLSCEVTPHHLLLDREVIVEDSGRFKVNPPLRSAQDREALVAALQSGLIDMIATDHAPHPAHYKTVSLAEAKPGFIGLDFMFPLLYTYLVKRQKLSLDRLVDATSTRVAKLFHLPNTLIEEYNVANFVVVNTKAWHVINQKNTKSACQNTPFWGWNLTGWPVYNVINGRVVRLKRY